MLYTFLFYLSILFMLFIILEVIKTLSLLLLLWGKHILCLNQTVFNNFCI